MLKINNLQKKIIKISTVISLVMISSFFLINKVSAAHTDLKPMDNKNPGEGFVNFTIEDIYTIRDNAGLSSYDGFLLTYGSNSSSGSQYMMTLFFFSKSRTPEYATTSTKGSINFSIDVKVARVRSIDLSSNTNIVDIFSTTSFFNLSSQYVSYSSTNFDTLYFSNVPITYNGVTYEPNDGPTSYEFNEDIDVTDISKIKINFELPEDTSNLDVDIKWTFDNYTSGGNGYITTPYLEFKHSNGDISLNQDISNLNGGDWFSDDYIVTLLPDSDITEISLIVDTVKASGLLKANFSSKFPYSISYEYTEEVEDHFITVDMDDYASISLIPKVYNLENGISSSISSPIYKYGIYDVEIWEDLETKKVIDRWDNHSTSQFIYPMYSGYKNCVIHFIKKEVDASERYIKFDSRYYSYVVKKYLNEEVTIINPNTNENIIIPDTSDLYKYDSPVDKRFSFNSFLKPIKFIFESITDFYNNYCPEVVQYFFYLIFAFFVILVLIKIFL